MQERNKQFWLDLWRRIGARGNAAMVYCDIAEHYAQPQRAYHNLNHIIDCLNEFKRARYFTLNPDAIEFAIWFHDAVYDAKARDNEEKSAKFALATIKSISLPHKFGDLVRDLILATKHDKIPSEFDAHFIVDIDLCIFGRPENEFNEYEKQIRKEYEWVEEKEYAKERVAILNYFTKRSAVYLTRFFNDRYETQARRNIARLIKQLSNQ